MAFRPLDQVTAAEISAVGIPMKEAEELYQRLTQIVRCYGAGSPQTWKNISKSLLRPDLPFAFHQMMYYGCYSSYYTTSSSSSESDSPLPPAWIPDPEIAVATNIGQMLEKHGKEFLGMKYKDPISSFSDFQEFSFSNPEVYWKMVFQEMNISFSVPPSCILRQHTSGEGQVLYPGGHWLPGAVLNSAGNCLSLSGKRNSNDVMVIWRNEGDDESPVNHMKLEDFQKEVCRVANALDTLGLAKGSSIAIDMPMNVTAVIIYLAVVLAGYVVVSIADSFAPREIATRLNISNAKAIFTQDVIVRGDKVLPLYRRVVDADAPLAIVVLARGSTFSMELRPSDISYHTFLERVDCSIGESYFMKLGEHLYFIELLCLDYGSVEQPVEAFTNILFSSGTTGEPKAIPWTHATPIKAAADAWSHMDIHKGDIVAWPTNLGWMMGPWLVYASLLNGASMALYDGSPLGSGFCKFVQDAKVTVLGVVPSIVRAWKTTDCTAGCDWSSIRCFSSSGEASNVDEYLWLMGRAHFKPVIEYCGGTEIGGGFPQSLSAFSTPAMGCNLFILGDDGKPLPQTMTATGELALDPVMFGASTTLLNANHYNVYFRGMPVWNGKVLRRHGDEFERITGGYYKAHGRADDTMNLGGIKVSSVEIERICNGVDETVLETAAIGVPPSGGGPEQLYITVVFKDPNHSGADLDTLKKAFNSAIQKKLNPLFRVSKVFSVPALPRTASNKVMRRVLRQQLTQNNQSPKL
ncbi:putative acyl-activating enzyme 17, peroxisomal [Asimina triloba]